MGHQLGSSLAQEQACLLLPAQAWLSQAVMDIHDMQSVHPGPSGSPREALGDTNKQCSQRSSLLSVCNRALCGPGDSHLLPSASLEQWEKWQLASQQADGC